MARKTNRKDTVRRIEVAVHLFDCINRYSINWGSEGPELYTMYDGNYSRENEKLMAGIYAERVARVAGDPEAVMLFVAHTPISCGILHENVKEVYLKVLDLMPGRHYLFDYVVEPERLAKALDGIVDKDALAVYAWGEKTTGCVLDESVRVHDALGISHDLGTILGSLVPSAGVDWEGCYPRHWERLNSMERQRRIVNFSRIADKRYNKRDYFGPEIR